MDPEFWHERWVRGEIGFHQASINSHLQAYWERLEVARGGRVFVPLCGKSLDMLWLLSQGLQVTGVEVSPMAVQGFFAENAIPVEVVSGRDFTEYRADDLTILCGDFFDLKPAHVAGTGGVYDRASLVALPPPMRARYAAHMKTLFPHGLTALLVTLEYPQHEMEGPPFCVSEEEIEALYGDGCRVERLLTFNALEEAPHFREKGLTRLEEKVYRLVAKDATRG